METSLQETKPARLPDASDARAAYGPQVNLYMQENAITWARFNAFTTANAFVFAAIGVSASGGLHLLAFVLPLFGLCLCFWWAKVMARGFAYVNHWREEACKAEALGFDTSLHAIHRAELLRKRQDSANRNANTKGAKDFATYIIVIVSILHVFALLQVVALIAGSHGYSVLGGWLLHRPP